MENLGTILIPSAVFILLPIILNFVYSKQRHSREFSEDDEEIIRKNAGESKLLDIVSFVLGLLILFGTLFFIRNEQFFILAPEFLRALFCLLILFYWGFVPSIFLHRSAFKENFNLVLNHEVVPGSGMIIRNFRSKIFSTRSMFVMAGVTIGVLVWMVSYTF